MKLSLYNGVKDSVGVAADFDTVLWRIQHGSRGLDKETRLLNVLHQTDRDAYTKHKLKLPAVTWSGCFKQRKTLIAHSGLIVLDFDNVDIGELLSEIHDDTHVLLAFVSPSGNGVKVVVRVEPVPASAKEHAVAFQAVCNAFEHYGDIDASGKDINRLCFLAHDPRALYHRIYTPIEWSKEDVQQEDTPVGDPIAVQITEDTHAFLRRYNIVFDDEGKSQYLPKG